VGGSAPSTVTAAYTAPFAFTGELGPITLEFAPDAAAASSAASDLAQQ